MYSLLSTLLVLSVAVVLVSSSVFRPNALEEKEQETTQGTTQDAPNGVIIQANLLDDMKKKFGSATPIFNKSNFKTNTIGSPDWNPPFSKLTGFKNSTNVQVDIWRATKKCAGPEGNKICVWNATWEHGVNENCNYSTYFKKAMVSSNPVTNQNKGVAKCTQKKCGSSDQPKVIDCLEAFGQKRITEIENTPEST